VSTRADVVVVGLGALGSAAAWHLARRGVSVVGVEQFALGHVRGASHDTSRILRRSYHTPGYVRLADAAYGAWADLSDAVGEALVTTTGGVDLFPPGAAIGPDAYLSSLSAAGVAHERLSGAETRDRWPALRVPDGTLVVAQPDTGIVPAARGVAAMQRAATRAGALLLYGTEVTGLAERAGAVDVRLADGSTCSAGTVVLTADAWTNDLLAHLEVRLPLTVTQEQVTYFAPTDPDAFAPGRCPVWIWMDDPSFYGFPTYPAADTGGWVKAAQDCGGRPTTAASRSFDPDPGAADRLAAFVAGLLPGSGPAVRTVTCLYTLTPDRDFVLDSVPGHPRVLVGLGAGHGFKFAPLLGRVLADLATLGGTDVDIAPFAADRAALTGSGPPVSWLV
jgi:sarcosine oxidase